MDLHPGQLLSHFRVIEKIDEGGMGVVYRARDLHLDRDVALKVLSTRHSLSDSANHRFRREALALSRLNHPNIAAVFDFDSDEGISFIAMEWIAGMTLDRAIASGPLPEDRILQYAEQITAALAYAHGEGVVHRDLKPRNLRITADGRVKILDFGLAKLRTVSDSDITDTMPGRVAGTLPYMAPELLSGEPASVSSDVYSVGVVLYEMATGRRAFPQQDTGAVIAAIQSEKPVPPRQLNPELSTELEQIILRALEKIPAYRYQSAAEMRADVQRVGSGLPLVARRRWSAPRHWPWMVLLVVVVGIALALTGLNGRRAPRGHPVMKPLVTWASAERDAHLSPDSQWVLFISNKGGTDAVWLQRLKGGEPTRVEAQQEGVVNALWSPDGENIGILVSKSGEASFDVVPAFGGRARASIPLPRNLANSSLVRWYGTRVYLEVSGDGVWRFDTSDGKAARFIGNGNRENRRGHFDVHPDEDRVVFTERRDRQLTMWLTRISSGASERLTIGDANDSSPRFGGRGGAYVFFASDRSGQVDLWRVALDSRKTEQLTFSPTAEEMQSVSDDLATLIFIEKRDEAHLWQFVAATGEHRQLTAESMRDDWPSIANHRIAIQRQKPLMLAGVASLLNGEIVVSSADKQPASAWTRVAEGGRPYLSPDGHRVAYVRSAGRRYLELRVNDLDTAADWLVTDRLRSPMFYVFPRDWMRRTIAWSPDGSLLYVSGTPAGGDQLAAWSEHAPPQALFAAPGGDEIREVEVEGDRVVFVTEPANGTAHVHLLDRRTREHRVLYSMQRDSMSSLWVRGRLRRGPLVVLIASVTPDFTENAMVLEVDDRGATRTIGSFAHSFVGTSKLDPVREVLYFTGADQQSVHNIFSFSFADGTVRPVTNNTVPGITFAGLEVDDQGNLLYVRQQVTQDLWAIEQS